MTKLLSTLLLAAAMFAPGVVVAASYPASPVAACRDGSAPATSLRPGGFCEQTASRQSLADTHPPLNTCPPGTKGVVDPAC